MRVARGPCVGNDAARVRASRAPQAMRYLPSKPSRLAHLAAAAVVLLALGGVGGCVRVSHSTVSSVGGEAAGARLDEAPHAERVTALAGELLALGPDVAPQEAAAVAAVAVRYSEELAEWYGMSGPVELHNVLVNLRLRRGGLCFQMAECMLAELRELPLRTLELRRAIAWKGDLWNEHNTVVVTAVGAPFESGVVLDAWRNAGRLRWAPVRMDHYPWEPKPAPPSETVLASRTAPSPPPSPAADEPEAVPASAVIGAAGDDLPPGDQAGFPHLFTSGMPPLPDDTPSH